MSMHHAWTGIPHNGLDPFSHRRLITVHRTFGACRLSFLEWTFLKALQRILCEPYALRAQFIIAVMTSTIQGYHQLDRFAFPRYS